MAARATAMCVHEHGYFIFTLRGRRGRDRMVVRFTTTNAISAFHR